MLNISLYAFYCVQGRVCGLCGNFDGNVNNDLMSSNNQLEVDSSHFGNSWKVIPSCADVAQVESGFRLKVWFTQITKHLKMNFLHNLFIWGFFLSKKN